VKVTDPCGCFPTGRHYPGIAHLLQVRAEGVASEFDASLPWAEQPIAFLDVETTGVDSTRDRLIEVGVVIGRGGEIVARHNWLVNPAMPIPPQSTAVHGITDADVADKPPFSAIAGELVAVLENALPAAYNASFDRGFILAELERAGFKPSAPPPALRREVEWIDPLVFARELYKSAQSRALGEMAARLGIYLENAHRATDDAEAALRVLYALGQDPRVPGPYGALIREQRRLARVQEESRFMRRRPS